MVKAGTYTLASDRTELGGAEDGAFFVFGCFAGGAPVDPRLVVCPFRKFPHSRSFR